MLNPNSMQVLARVGSALAAAESETTVHDALRALQELGIVVHGPGRGEPWLSIAHGQRRLALSAVAAEPDSDFRSLLAALFRLAFERDEERQQLRRVRERMELLSEASFEGLFFHVDGAVVDANQRVCEMLGYEHAEILGDMTLRRCVAPEDLPGVVQRIAEGYEGAYVITGVRKDGSRFRAELQAKQGKLGDRPVRVAAVRDVTLRERTEALLRESETRLRNLAEATYDLTVFTRDGVILDVAGALEGVLGYTREQFVGRHGLDFVASTAAPTAAQTLLEPSGGKYETVVVAANGELVPMEVVAVISTLDGLPVRVSAMRDLRESRRLEQERRKLEQELERSQRLDSLGVLAGGIAHDFNNLLTSLLGNAEMLSERARDPLDRVYVQAILDAGRRAASLTAQMLAYAGRKELGPRQPVDFGVLAQELRTLLSATLSKKASLRISIQEGSVVLGNRATLTQVLMNLLTNASDALAGEPGTIEVRTRLTSEPGPRFAHALGAKIDPGKWVLLEVSDTGQGMDEAIQQRVFEPFFSTKAKGHGLGLAACLGIVSSHGGAIVVDSAKGRGSTFSVVLPAHEAVTPVEPVQRVATNATGRKVLVVDDEPMLRNHLRRALSPRGYDVQEAHNGQSALLALEGGEPDVVILDMTMPDLSGIEVLRRMRRNGCRVPVILSSGYHDATLELEQGQFQSFLLKPYTVAELVEVLDGVLTGEENR